MNIKVMYRNNDFIYEATSKLEKLIDIPMQVESNGNNYDALLTINNIQFIVETKSTVRTSNQGFFLVQLEELKNNTNRESHSCVPKYISILTKILN